MQRYLNDTGIPLSIAVYLAHDTYDHDDDPDTISATALIKPLRPIILAERVPEEDRSVDILALLKSRLGSSIHDGVEKAWLHGNFQDAMKRLGYPQRVIDRVVVNPEGEVPPGKLPVYVEQRTHREIDGVRVSGKFDFVAEGRVEDVKSTSTFAYVNQLNFRSYQLQGSIYRWLNPEIITQDHMAIQYIFTDFKAFEAKRENYPNNATQQQLIPLLSLADTEAYIRQKLQAIRKFRPLAQEDLPRCSDEDLWRSAPVYKYYKNPDKKTRSTKNFDSYAEAHTFMLKQGNVGEIDTKPGEVVACKYCPAFSICTQKDEYIADGSLKA